MVLCLRVFDACCCQQTSFVASGPREECRFCLFEPAFGSAFHLVGSPKGEEPEIQQSDRSGGGGGGLGPPRLPPHPPIMLRCRVLLPNFIAPKKCWRGGGEGGGVGPGGGGGASAPEPPTCVHLLMGQRACIKKRAITLKTRRQTAIWPPRTERGRTFKDVDLNRRDDGSEDGFHAQLVLPDLWFVHHQRRKRARAVAYERGTTCERICSGVCPWTCPVSGPMRTQCFEIKGMERRRGQRMGGGGCDLIKKQTNANQR